MSRVAGRFPFLPPRPVFVVPSAVALLLGMWAGLSRIGWDLPSQVQLDARHGPLMISSFLGTLISLERAVGSGWRWAYVGPLLAGLGAISLVAVETLEVSQVLFLGAAICLVALFSLLLRRFRQWPLTTLWLGAVLWLVGNAFWLAGDSLPKVTPWWIAFLVITIAGERLELADFLSRRRAVGQSFLLALFPLVVGLAMTRWYQAAGQQAIGLGMLALAVWLLRYDIARRGLRRPEPTRYIAISLLAGYAWLAFAGGLWVVGRYLDALFLYDAMLHAVLLGFVMSMVFGHSLIILPATIPLRIEFRRRFYAHLLVFHLSVALRVGADLDALADMRRWAGLLNVIAVLLFLASTLAAARLSRTAVTRAAGGALRKVPGA